MSDQRTVENSVGYLLWHTRHEQGYDLGDIADYLKIRYNYLHAIEQDQFHALPGAAFVQGYLKSYADFLQLNPDHVVDLYLQQTAAIRADKHKKSQYFTPQPVHRESVPRYVILSVSLALFVMLYLGWTMWQSHLQAEKTASEPVPMPEDMQAYFDQFEPIMEPPPIADTAPPVATPVAASAPAPQSAIDSTPASVDKLAQPGSAAKQPTVTIPQPENASGSTPTVQE